MIKGQGWRTSGLALTLAPREGGKEGWDLIGDTLEFLALTCLTSEDSANHAEKAIHTRQV